MVKSSTPQNSVVRNLGVPAREKVTGKTARHDEFITFGRNLVCEIVISLSIGYCAAGTLLCLSPVAV
jgi:hypothetical protein